MVLGEGAGAVVLEERQSALARGARVLGEVAGSSSSSVRQPDGIVDYEQALYNAMAGALRHSGIAAERVGHVSAHGLSTQKCDAEEARAIRRVFSGRAIPVAAPKSSFGNLGAGGGMVELIASVQALAHGRLFRTLNYETPDPQCELHVSRGDEPAGDSFVTVNITPQGQAAAVVVRAVR
jgi:3-oxoacyl-[acyl-carrier-protein] synthase II